MRGQYLSYDASDDNTYEERMVRSLKEEEIWPNAYQKFAEAYAAIECHVHYYNP
jgi:hypothetical protein